MFSIEMMCRVLDVSRSGYYIWLKSVPSKRTIENNKLIEQIQLIHKQSKETYGSPRITKELRARYYLVSRPRVARLMKKAKIRSVTKKKFVVTTFSKHGFALSPNLLNREFKPNQQGKVWVSDITYVRTTEGWLYLTVIIYLADRKVIGWSTSKTMKAADTIIPAWKMAVINRPLVRRLIFHSDQGIQYACNEFREVIRREKLIIQSMSRKGNCWDNACAESFFKSIKTEWIYRFKYKTIKSAALSIFEYIETWYNTCRRHSSLNYLSPLEYGRLLNNEKRAA
jgi:putative transposase